MGSHRMRTTHLLLLLFFLSFGGCGSHQDLKVVHQEAYQAYQEENYPIAVEKFEILVQEIPKDAELWFRLGNSYARAMMPGSAVEAYRNSLLRDPKNVKAWYNMGIIQMQTALKSFADMQGYVNEGDPIGIQGKAMMDGLFTLLGSENEYESDQ